MVVVQNVSGTDHGGPAYRCAHAGYAGWNDPQKYEDFQTKIRQNAKPRTTPLALENEWWMEEARASE
jgi:hypothetical protein